MQEKLSPPQYGKGVDSMDRLDVMIEAVQRAEQDLRDYRWMADRVAEHYARNRDEDIQAATAKYGIEATMPRGSGVSDPVVREVQKRMREFERIRRFEEKLKRIDEAVAKITDERVRAVAEALMDGERLYMIAQQIGVSRSTAYELRKQVVRHLALALYSEMVA
jgi:DNA-binding NarL/FixJ family response regulator